MFLRGSSTKKTDEELVREYRHSKDLRCLSDLFLRYASMVYGVCLKYLRDRDEAKDAVMQIHEKMIENLLRHEVVNFKSWLYTSARNHCLMQLRSKKGKQTEEISLFIVENGFETHLEAEVEKEEDMTKLEKCIGRLIESQQACVRLFFLQEKSYQEVVRATGFDLNQVKSYIQNGKRNLKICMEEHAG